MKKVFLFLAALSLVIVLLPSKSVAQVLVTDAPAYMNFTINEGGGKINLNNISESTRVKLTPSGNCQAKVEFPAPPELYGAIPAEGSVEFPIYRFAVWIDQDINNTHWEALYTYIRIESSGTCYVVCNLKAADGDNN